MTLDEIKSAIFPLSGEDKTALKAWLWNQSFEVHNGGAHTDSGGGPTTPPTTPIPPKNPNG